MTDPQLWKCDIDIKTEKQAKIMEETKCRLAHMFSLNLWPGHNTIQKEKIILMNKSF